MLYDLASDLHCNSYLQKPNEGVRSVDWATERNPGSAVLVLAGDIHDRFKKTFRVIDRALPYYEHILLVDGNHEHWGSMPWNRSTLFAPRPVRVNMKFMQQAAYRRKRVAYLDGNTHYRRGDVVFVGSNGWYDWRIMCPEISEADQHKAWLGWDWTRDRQDDHRPHMQDKYLNFNIADHAGWHALRLREMVEKFSADPTVNQIVVVTHTAPRRELLRDNPFDLSGQRFNGSYANSQMSEVYRLPGHKIVHWCYGHTHDRRDITIDGIRYINNARGYASEQWRQREWKLEQFDTDVV